MASIVIAWIRLIAAFLILVPHTAMARDAGRPETPIAALRDGGYVIYFRHARTDWSTQDTDRDNLRNCSTQRLLSDEGRHQSHAIGEAFRALAIPVGEILASPYCRTLETARLAFGNARPTPGLRHLFPENRQNAEQVAQGLRPLLMVAPAPGTNTVLVSHGFNLRAVAGVQLAEGEAAVIRPDGHGSYALVGRLRSEAFTAAAAAAR